MDKLEKAITSGDWFGHIISLNFKKSERTHKTLIGGILSFLVKMSLLVYLAYLICLHSFGPKQVTLSYKNLEDEEISFKSMNQKIYMLLYDS